MSPRPGVHQTASVTINSFEALLQKERKESTKWVSEWGRERGREGRKARKGLGVQGLQSFSGSSAATLGSKVSPNPAKPYPNRFQIKLQNLFTSPIGFQTGFPQLCCRNLSELGFNLEPQTPSTWHKVPEKCGVKNSLFWGSVFFSFGLLFSMFLDIFWEKKYMQGDKTCFQ